MVIFAESPVQIELFGTAKKLFSIWAFTATVNVVSALHPPLQQSVNMW